MRGVYWTLLVVLIATVCLAQDQQPNQLASAGGAAMQEPATDQQAGASVSSGDRTFVGCVAIAAPGPGYVLKTEGGRTVPLRGAADLAPYLGKKVQIQANWTSRGIHVAAPMEGKEANAAAAPGASAQTSQQFAGDLHLQFKGKVIGDCLGEKK